MSVQFSVYSGAVALVSATAKTVVEIDMGASLPGELIALDVSSSYATTATPITLLVELGTATGTGTGSAYTPRRFGQAVGTALETVKTNCTVEPSTITVAEAWELVLPAGPFTYQWPLGREFFLAVSSFNVVRLTASAAATVYVNAVYEV